MFSLSEQSYVQLHIFFNIYNNYYWFIKLKYNILILDVKNPHQNPHLIPKFWQCLHQRVSPLWRVLLNHWDAHIKLAWKILGQFTFTSVNCIDVANILEHSAHMTGQYLTVFICKASTSIKTTVRKNKKIKTKFVSRPLWSPLTTMFSYCCLFHYKDTLKGITLSLHLGYLRNALSIDIGFVVLFATLLG